MQPPPPQGFLVTAGMPPSQGSGRPVSAEAARMRAAEQMAFEDAWKALNPDFRTPFASVEDAVSRLLPYHVFADYEEDDDVVLEHINGGSSSISTTNEKSSAQIWDDDMEAQVEGFFEHFEKQLLTFNVMTQQHAAGFNRAEEQLILDRSVFEDERQQLDRLQVAVVQEQQEAVRARLALMQAQAQAQAQAAGGGWQVAQPAASWQAFVAAGRGEGASRGQALAPAVVMQQQQQQQQQETMMTAGSWQVLAAAASRGEGGSNEQALIQAVMLQHMQRQRQQEEMMAVASRGEGASSRGQVLSPAMVTQLMQQQNQQRHQEEVMRQLHLLQQQQHQQEAMTAGRWQLDLGGQQTYVVPRGDGSSSSQAALPPAMLQPGPGQGQASIAGNGMALPWHGIAEGREQ